MSRTINNVTVWRVRTLPQGYGVAIVVLVALALGLLLRWSAEGSTRAYQSADGRFSMAYPASWRTNDVTDTVALRVENPQAELGLQNKRHGQTRELDTTAPPTLQELIDRRVQQRGSMTGYHFLSSTERTVSGERAAEIDYAFIAQPIDTPRRAALPVVARSREYIVLTKDRVYYVTLAAPDSDFNRANSQFDTMLQTVKVQ